MELDLFLDGGLGSSEGGWCFYTDAHGALRCHRAISWWSRHLERAGPEALSPPVRRLCQLSCQRVPVAIAPQIRRKIVPGHDRLLPPVIDILLEIEALLLELVLWGDGWARPGVRGGGRRRPGRLAPCSRLGLGRHVATIFDHAV